MGLGELLMKVVVKVQDVVALARRFESSPVEAMREVVTQVRAVVVSTLEQVMDAEIELFLGQDEEAANKRNGYASRTFGIKGLGCFRLKVPRDRAGRFESKVVPRRRRYDDATEKDLALLHLAGLSTRTLALISHRILGIKVSAQEVSNSLTTIIPAAKRFLERSLSDRTWMYLYIDGTNFKVQRTTVDTEPTLVVLGVDTTGHKSVIAMVQGDKEDRRAWEMVFSQLKERRLDAKAVQLGIMDGLPGLEQAFREAFPRARTGRCWVHKSRNVLSRVPRRYQAEFKNDFDGVQYAESQEAAREVFNALKSKWGKVCEDAVRTMEKDIDALLVHYEFPKEHWEALRTTNPIERVNKEFKRRSKAMEKVGPGGLQALLAFTALRLEVGWTTTPITSSKLMYLGHRERYEARRLDAVTRLLQ